MSVFRFLQPRKQSKSACCRCNCGKGRTVLERHAPDGAHLCGVLHSLQRYAAVEREIADFNFFRHLGQYYGLQLFTAGERAFPKIEPLFFAAVKEGHLFELLAIAKHIGGIIVVLVAAAERSVAGQGQRFEGAAGERRVIRASRRPPPCAGWCSS